MISMSNLIEIVDFAKDLLTKYGYIYPVILIEGTKGSETRPYPSLPERDKVVILEALGFTLAFEDHIGELLQITSVCEAWIGRDPSIRPSKDTKRIEAVFIVQFDANMHSTNFAYYKIIRNKGSDVINLETVKNPDTASKDIIFGPYLDALVRGFNRGRIKWREQS